MAAASITREVFGKMADGRNVYLYTMTAGSISVRVINVGCSVKDILVPDNHGNIVDINLGYDSLSGYEKNPAYLGCICGRVSNRIDGATFTLDGTRYDVSKNDPLGNNMCHGGHTGLSRRYFNGSIDGTKLVFTYTDEDGSEGFPGDVTITVTYELTEDSGLMMDYQATTNKATPIDLSNHFLVNLAGHNAGTLQDHMVTMHASRKLDFNERFIPTGEISDVNGTVCDMRKPVRLGDVLDKMPAGDGMHHAMITDGKEGEKRMVARVVHPSSQRYMEVYSTEPVFVAYSGYYLDFLLKGATCKGGETYKQSGAILFMPQGYPDAVNQSKFPSCIVRPGETYHTTSWYKFGVTS